MKASPTESFNSQALPQSSNGGGLDTASKVGSIIGAVIGALAVAVSVYFGVKTVKKRHVKHSNEADVSSQPSIDEAKR